MMGKCVLRNISLKEELADFGLVTGLILSVKWKIIICCLLSVFVAIGMLFLFRYAVAFVVWGILVGSFLILVVLSIVFWYFNTTDENSILEEETTNVLKFVFTILAMVLAIAFIWGRKKIQQVIILHKQATFDMRGLITLSLICIFGITILAVIFGAIILAMYSSGTLEAVPNKHRSGFYHYEFSKVFLFTTLYAVLILYWIRQFSTGIQCMIVSGAVSKWYFTRDKNCKRSAILTSTKIAFRYHLGTVAFGILMISIIKVTKGIILSATGMDFFLSLVPFCVDPFEIFFESLSEKAYIITAMHGQGLIRSGKRAAMFIIQNIGDLIRRHFIGSFVLLIAKFLIVFISVLLSLGVLAIQPELFSLKTIILTVVIVSLYAYLVACISFGVFGATVDTLLMCHSEEKLLNDLNNLNDLNDVVT